MWREAFGFSPEDIAADRFGSTYEQFATFRLLPETQGSTTR